MNGTRRIAVNQLLDRLDKKLEPLSMQALGEAFGAEFWTVLHDFTVATAARDDFARTALPVLLQWEGPSYDMRTRRPTSLDVVAESCYVIADAMMQARQGGAAPPAAAPEKPA